MFFDNSFRPIGGFLHFYKTQEGALPFAADVNIARVEKKLR